jgi:mono/diheme cytochrome c family protein
MMPQSAASTNLAKEGFMRKTLVALVLSLAASLIASSSLASAQTDAAKLYQGKCVACHGADGSGSAIGKNLGAHDFHSPEVQKQSDAQLAEAIAKGRGKMPSYEKSLGADDIKALVAFLRALGKP